MSFCLRHTPQSSVLEMSDAVRRDTREKVIPIADSGWSWVKWAWEASISNSSEKFVLVALAQHANREGTCYPSVARIMRRTALGERCVQSKLKSLEMRGLLRRTTRAGTSTLYYLTPVTDVPSQVGRAAADAPHPRKTCTPPPQQMHPTPAIGAPKLPKTTNKKTINEFVPDKNLAFKDVEPASHFNIFLTSFPRIGDLAKTKNEFCKAVEAGADPLEIIDASCEYAKEQKGNEQRFIAYSHNWLLQKRWVRFVPKNITHDSGTANDRLADAIKAKRHWVQSYTSAHKARELISLGLVSAEECKAAKVDI